jgi:hypothetical protein
MQPLTLTNFIRIFPKNGKRVEFGQQRKKGLKWNFCLVWCWSYLLASTREWIEEGRIWSLWLRWKWGWAWERKSRGKVGFCFTDFQWNEKMNKGLVLVFVLSRRIVGPMAYLHIPHWPRLDYTISFITMVQLQFSTWFTSLIIITSNI